MNNVMRGCAMTGLAVAAGLIVGAGPAAAATGSPVAAEAKSKAPAVAHAKSRTRVLGFYRSPGACHRDGRRGEFRHQWEDHDCIPVREGFRRGWALKVYYGWGGDHYDPHGSDHGSDHGWDHGSDHGPDRGPHGPWQKN
jgi:hypothetical protein